MKFRKCISILKGMVDTFVEIREFDDLLVYKQFQSDYYLLVMSNYPYSGTTDCYKQLILRKFVNAELSDDSDWDSD